MQAQLVCSMQQMPTSAGNLPTVALLQQLQLATTPTAVHIFFSLLQCSLGLHPSTRQTPEVRPISSQSSTLGTGSSPLTCGSGASQRQRDSVSDSHIGTVLRQPWLMTHYLADHPCGPAVATAWDSGLTELLHAVLSLTQAAESSRTAPTNALEKLCQPYIARYVSLVWLLSMGASCMWIPWPKWFSRLSTSHILHSKAFSLHHC